MNKSILRQFQDEIRERKWSIPELAAEVGVDRILLWKKLAELPRKSRSKRVSMDNAEIEAIATALRKRNPAFVVCYPNHRRRRQAA